MGGSSNLETDVSLKANVVSHHARGISLLNHVEPGWFMWDHFNHVGPVEPWPCGLGKSQRSIHHSPTRQGQPSEMPWQKTWSRSKPSWHHFKSSSSSSSSSSASSSSSPSFRLRSSLASWFSNKLLRLKMASPSSSATLKAWACLHYVMCPIGGPDLTQCWSNEYKRPWFKTYWPFWGWFPSILVHFEGHPGDNTSR